MASAKPKLTEKRRRVEDGFGKTEAYEETKEGGGLASAKPKLTEKRRRVEDWLWRNRSLLRNKGRELW
jgi:hypothetical protein